MLTLVRMRFSISRVGKGIREQQAQLANLEYSSPLITTQIEYEYMPRRKPHVDADQTIYTLACHDADAMGHRDAGMVLEAKESKSPDTPSNDMMTPDIIMKSNEREESKLLYPSQVRCFVSSKPVQKLFSMSANISVSRNNPSLVL